MGCNPDQVKKKINCQLIIQLKFLTYPNWNNHNPANGKMFLHSPKELGFLGKEIIPTAVDVLIQDHNLCNKWTQIGTGFAKNSWHKGWYLRKHLSLYALVNPEGLSSSWTQRHTGHQCKTRYGHAFPYPLSGPSNFISWSLWADLQKQAHTWHIIVIKPESY